MTEIYKTEIPHELPESWKWVRLAEVSHDWGQKKPDVEFTYIDVSAINKEQGIISDDVNILQPGEAPSRARKIVSKGTVIYATVRPYLLNIAIVDKQFEPEPIVSTAFAVLYPFSGIFNKYLYYYLRSKPFIKYVETQMKGMAYPAINDGQLYEGLVPLPPSNEQKRIVAKVEQLMALCDELEARQQKRREGRVRLNNAALDQLLTTSDPDEFSKHWQHICDNFDLLYSTPENIGKLRQAILHLAVQGKLVPQDANDEPASILLEKIKDEKERLIKENKIKKPAPLPPSEIDEVLFNLPNFWTWIRLGQVVKSVRYGTYKNCSYEQNGVPVLRIPNLVNGSIEKEDLKFTTLPNREFQELQLVKDDLLMIRSNGSKSLVGRTAVVSSDVDGYAYAGYLVRLRLFLELVYPKYLHLAINTHFVRKQIEIPIITTSGVKNINSTEIINLLLPLPPYKEQKRIVAKVNQLMALCDELEAKLTQSQTNSEKLMDASVHQVLTA